MLIADLCSEIQTDPSALGLAALAAANNDQGIADAINAALVPVVGRVGRADFLKWAAETGMRHVIQDEANDPISPVRDSALVLIDICRGSTGGIDFAKAGNIALLDGWVAASKLTTTDRAILLTLATKQVSRSEVLFGQLITAQNVAQAVRDDFGNSLFRTEK